ncbi:MAG TPA: ABC transporter permease [Chthonomonadaceae bacterium]|nr:ABC transporter permease [Chthonomonadaceae bacterium]
MKRRIALGGLLRPLLSVLAGLLLAAILVQASGYNAPAAFAALWTGATGLRGGAASPSPTTLVFHLGGWQGALNLFVLAQSLARVTPLLLTGLAVALGLRAGLFNIGAQGQMTCGALAAAIVGQIGAAPATGGPSLLKIGLVLLIGAAAGALWGALPGLLKAARGVHEVLSTIMLNYIAANIAGYLITHGLKDPHSMAAQTDRIALSTWLPPLVAGSNLTAGLFLALLAVLLYAFLMRRTALGYEIRAVGQGAEAARAAGIPVGRTLVTALALSGALAGLAGAIQVVGIHHRYLEGIEGTYGFDGIAVALLGNLQAGGVAAAALFFGALANGAAFMQLQTDVPDSVAVVVQAVVILFAGVRVARGWWARRRTPPTPVPVAAEERQPDYAPL